MNKLAIYVDGFNLYHGVCEMVKTHQLDGYKKWWDIKKWAATVALQYQAELVEVVIVTASPKHKLAETRIHHSLFFDMCRKFGCQVIEGEFINTRLCTCGYTDWVEKQSDINLSIAAILGTQVHQLTHTVLVTADTDQIATIRRLRNMNTKVILRHPPYRESKVLRGMVDKYDPMLNSWSDWDKYLLPALHQGVTCPYKNHPDFHKPLTLRV